VAGLSAGGAMAATLAATYPELYAALGVHSGLAHGAANDLMSAFKAMREGPGKALPTPPEPALPTIVFHGDRDTTVHPRNGEQLVLAAREVARTPALAEATSAIEYGQVPNGRAYTRTTYLDPRGQPLSEHWLVHGCGHAWSGGSSAGSYTDPQGPDASAQMLRFFLQHRRND
jgi:poly(3-hydroxybutyrate) depolymerase